MMRVLLIFIFAIVSALTTWALSPREAFTSERHGLWHVSELPYSNPAVNQWRMTFGLTEVSADIFSRNDTGDIDPRLGTGEFQMSAGAETYTKFRNTTLWGHGRYIKGKSEAVVWNETSDIDIIYPYVLADSAGGDLDREQYAFCGGYAVTSGRWAWGATMSYLATLEYRAVDPRPKNVVGKLDMAVGMAYNLFGRYYAGMSFNFRKYKQNNDIDFKSELGVDKIFHLTGLVTHYNRFAGTGLSTYYDGYRYGISVDMYPRNGCGGFVSCAMSRFSFDNILTDLNKLPLAFVGHNEILVQAGRFHPGKELSWAVSGTMKAYRRHGTENIFGDAISSVYPQIASNTLFADNFCSFSAKAMLDFNNFGALRLSVTANGGLSQRTMAYIEPSLYTLVKNVNYGVDVKADFNIGAKWSGTFGVCIDSTMPFDCSADLSKPVADDDMRGLHAIEMHSYELQSHNRFTSSASIGFGRMLTEKYMLRLDMCRTSNRYADSNYSNRYAVKLSFIF